MKSDCLIVFIIAFSVVFSSCATVKDSARVIPEPVSEYIDINGTDFQNYELSDCSRDDYNIIEQVYNVYAPIEMVWKSYLSTGLTSVFSGDIMNFGVMYNPMDSGLYNSEDALPSIVEGQIFIIELTYLGFYNIPAAFKVTQIDTRKKMIQFIYLKNNKSNGYQQILFNSATDSHGMAVTAVTHISYFKSDNNLRDKLL